MFLTKYNKFECTLTCYIISLRVPTDLPLAFGMIGYGKKDREMAVLAFDQKFQELTLLERRVSVSM